MSSPRKLEYRSNYPSRDENFSLLPIYFAQQSDLHWFEVQRWQRTSDCNRRHSVIDKLIDKEYLWFRNVVIDRAVMYCRQKITFGFRNLFEVNSCKKKSLGFDLVKVKQSFYLLILFIYLLSIYSNYKCKSDWEMSLKCWSENSFKNSFPETSG